jgi:hypothetical protein
MLVHQMRRAAECAAESVGSFDDLLGKLPDGFRRTMYPARQRLAELLGISDFNPPVRQVLRPSRPSALLKGEIVATDANLFVIKLYMRIVRTSGISSSLEGSRATSASYSLTVHYFGKEIESEEFDVLCSYLESEFSVELSPWYVNSDKFDDLKEEGRVSPPMPTADELAAAEVLSEKDARTLAIAIKQASGLLVGDLSRQLPQDARSRTEQIRDSLQNSGIVTAETVVICKKTNAQVSRVPDQSVLVTLAREGLRCACGNTITDEKVDTAVSISDRGQWLLDGSHWFTLLLINGLVEFGVPLDRILVDQVSGGDEMDCIADVGGEIVLFELKDKEFNLGNAYSFGAKIGIIEPEHAVIVTTQYIGNDAKEHFARSRRKPREAWASVDEGSSEQTVTYIEGMNNFKPGLMDLISRVAMTDAQGALSDVLPRGTLPTSVVLTSLSERFLPAQEASSPPKPGRRRIAKTVEGEV